MDPYMFGALMVLLSVWWIQGFGEWFKASKYADPHYPMRPDRRALHRGVKDLLNPRE